MKKKLTPKQARFVDEYCIDCNATQAAIRAGYSKKNADKIGSQLTAHPVVAAAIEALRAKVSDKAEVDAVWVREKLRRVVELSLCLRPRLVKMNDEFSGRRVKRTVRTYDAHAAVAALKLLGQDKGLFRDKVDVNLTMNEFDKLSTPELLAKAKELGVKGTT